MVAIPPTHPPTTAIHGPPKRRLTMTWHAHNNHTPPLHAHPWLRHRDSAAPTGSFTTIDTPPRRVAALWSQFPPRTHPQPPTLRPSNNAAPRTPLATPIHNLATAAFADTTSTPPAPIGEPKLRAYPYADSLPSAPCPTATATPPTPTTEPELQASAQPRPRPSHNGLYLQQLAIGCRLKKSDRFSLCKLQRTEN